MSTGPARCVIFVKNTTEAVNKAARRIHLAEDDVVLISLMEHHSNDLPWRNRAQVVHAAVSADGRLDVEDLRQKFVQYGPRVKLLAISGASNVTGAINPIHELAELAHGHGVPILVDAAQLAPHRAINLLPANDPGHIDFLVASAHKMYAPYGTGVLIGPRSVFEQEGPDYSGGGTVEIVTEDEVYWNSPPERDEAGSPNVLGAVAMAAACRVLTEIGMDRLAEHESALTRYALTELGKIPGIEIYGDSDPARADQRLGVIPLNIKGLSHYLVAAVLSVEYGIGVRNGCFCAHPYVLRLLDIPDPVAWSWRKQVISGVRAHLPGLVRISFGCYNSAEEVDWLVKGAAQHCARRDCRRLRAGPGQRPLPGAKFSPGAGRVLQAVEVRMGFFDRCAKRSPAAAVRRQTPISTGSTPNAAAVVSRLRAALTCAMSPARLTKAIPGSCAKAWSARAPVAASRR